MPIRFRELKGTLAEQRVPMLLVDYFVQPDGVLLFIVRPDWDVPCCVKLDIDEGRLAMWRDDFERQVIRYRGRGPQTWTSFANELVEPIGEYVQAGDIVYLIPHGGLHGIPIHALPLRGAPLLRSHAVVYLPAASLLPLCQSRSGDSSQLSTACALGVEFEDEARDVAALFPGSRLAIGDLTTDRIATECSECDVVHFSCHGYYDPLDPKKSGLVIKRHAGSGALPDDAVLSSDQIIRMRLQAELVFLSACQSGVGRLVHGDEQLGILRAFFLAGASSIISTLWPVDAQVTREFVVAFYSDLLATFRDTRRIDKPAALRHAQLALLQRHGDSEAYIWAPFMLSGDWK